MSVGNKIVQMRLRLKRTQRELSETTGLAVSYLSRLENDQITPTVRTLGKIAKAFAVPLTAFFDSEPLLEAQDRCPVSLSGKCILDQLYVSRRNIPHPNVEAYSSQQLEVLRLCNFLGHTRDKELLRALNTMLQSLLALSQSRAAGARNKKGLGSGGPKRPTPHEGRVKRVT